MKWSLNELQKYKDTPLHIDDTLDLDATLTERFPEMILHVDPVKVSGYLSYKDGDVMVTIKVDTNLTVPSSRSLTPVPFPTQFEFTEFYLPSSEHLDRYEKDETVIVLDNETIDLDEAVAENIVLQIPMRILSPEESEGAPMPTGHDWEVISEDDYDDAQAVEDNSVDPRLAKLKELFPDQDNNDN
ncbi:YceD family protein [Paucilactobacillus sp. N302-9]